jgi:hypothetical protein
MLTHLFLPISVQILTFIQKALTLVFTSTVRFTKVMCLVVDSHDHPCGMMNQLMISEPTGQDFFIDYLILAVFMTEARSILYNITYSISILLRTLDLFFAAYYILCL